MAKYRIVPCKRMVKYTGDKWWEAEKQTKRFSIFNMWTKCSGSEWTNPKLVEEWIDKQSSLEAFLKIPPREYP